MKGYSFYQSPGGLETSGQVDGNGHGQLTTNKVPMIVIHHTALTSYDDKKLDVTLKGINNNHFSRINSTPNNRGNNIAYNFLVKKDGGVVQARAIGEFGGHTKNQEINLDSVAIAYLNNGKEPPTDEQYRSMRLLVHELKLIEPKAQVTTHGKIDGEHTSCGSNIDIGRIYKIDFYNTLGSDREIIGCFNPSTNKFKDPKSKDRTACYGDGGGRQNIFIPPLDQIGERKKIYTDDQIIDRFALVNFESSFDPNAKRQSCAFVSNGWSTSCDVGYVQMNSIHKPNNMSYEIWDKTQRLDITYSLQWMKQREDRMLEQFCSRFWKEENTMEGYSPGHDAVLACLYRVHNQNNKVGSDRAKYRMKVRDFYLKYFE